MSNFFEELKKYFEVTPRDKVLEDWAKSAEFDDVGPTVESFYSEEHLGVCFIKDKLKNLIYNFPQMKVSYVFDVLSNSHIIEVLPSEEFKRNVEYSKYETQLILEFITKYPNEDIVFVTENDLIEVTKTSFVKKGVLYNPSNKNMSWND